MASTSSADGPAVPPGGQAVAQVHQALRSAGLDARSPNSAYALSALCESRYALAL